MAEIQSSTSEPLATPPNSVATQTRPPQQRGPPLHQIYALPAPIRTFPLPTFYPNNPISLFHIAWAWLGQVFSPPPAEPAVIHEGIWSEATSSVHVKDEKAQRAMWEQGFYGKGSLSRSEPNWLKREQVRQGLQEVHVSELVTAQRREERIRAKWERARLEQEAIRQTRLEEARQAQLRLEAELEKEARLAKLAAQVEDAAQEVVSDLHHAAPVSPATLLALPNSLAELEKVSLNGHAKEMNGSVNGIGLINGFNEVNEMPAVDGSAKTVTESSESVPNSSKAQDDSTSPSSETSESSKSLKRQKSVRFSPTVESTTFGLHDPPSPNHSAALATLDGTADIGGRVVTAKANGAAAIADDGVPEPVNGPVAILNREHLQLMPEEAFFLSFGLGALRVTDPTTGKDLDTQELFTLFRQHSYFPPRAGPDDPPLQPDDHFLVHYSVYHHFRSLGWVPRGGIKFGVDWLLYTRGPVFDHAEFGLIVIPSFSDAEWKEAGKHSPQKTWQWLHATVRVLSHVTKSLVLVYVDVPPPSKFDEALEKGIAEVFKLYKVREVMVKRWSSNRNR